MILYHRTDRKSAELILCDGFKDGSGTYLTDRVWRGVWLSDTALDGNEGAYGEVLLAVHLHIPARELRERYEWKERGKGYREFLIPAEVLNRHVKKIDVAEGWVRHTSKITRRITESAPIRRTLGLARERRKTPEEAIPAQAEVMPREEDLPLPLMARGELKQFITRTKNQLKVVRQRSRELDSLIKARKVPDRARTGN